MKRNLTALAAMTACGIAADASLMSVRSRQFGEGIKIKQQLAMPTDVDFQRARVTDPNQSEIIRQRLYDFQLYALAGAQQLSFFQEPQGGGTTSTPGAVVGSRKTLSDTNMQLAGQLPSGMQYMAESIEVLFFPGSSNVASTFTPAKVTTDATAALLAAGVSALNDVWQIYNEGLLKLNILNKTYLTETPLRLFPPKTWMTTDSSSATTVAATSLLISSAKIEGRPYYLEPNISFQPATNFSVTIDYPAARALPSGFNGRIGVAFDGYLMRAAQ